MVLFGGMLICLFCVTVTMKSTWQSFRLLLFSIQLFSVALENELKDLDNRLYSFTILF